MQTVRLRDFPTTWLDVFAEAPMQGLEDRRGDVALTQNPAVFGAAVDPATALAIAGLPPECGQDPATGSAAGPLGAYVKRHTGVIAIRVDQGIEMGAHSVLQVSTADDIVVSGTVWLVGTGTLRLPA